MYREKFRRRLPASLDEPHGSAHGVVDLPLHMAWSGMTPQDLGKPRRRMDLYRTVLHEGLRDDLPRYLNQDLLLQLWPVLRTLVGRTVRAVWEDLDVATENPAPNATSTSGGPLGVSTVHGNHDEVSARASPERQSCETGAGSTTRQHTVRI
ncbi:hypothetical protein [Streptomyces phaeochromogenes]|uniref:hypothetical protein n=1 Tax=Streptomyces phaeochromogenes TaxID=1923 RepID=UPI00340589C3